MKSSIKFVLTVSELREWNFYNYSTDPGKQRLEQVPVYHGIVPLQDCRWNRVIKKS